VTVLRFINEFELCSLETTQKLALHLASCLTPSDTILLKGPLGAGKTAFARFLIQAMMGPDTVVQSPTFPLILPYETPKGLLWHVDLYRLSQAETQALGLEDHWRHHMTLIEWPERLNDYPPHCLELFFSLGGTTRRILINGTTHWEDKLNECMRGASL
jgi:tRNA threonylcarbamoyladenosine biosynthesis protein TsaE